MTTEDIFIGPLIRLEHAGEDRRQLASDLAPELLGWVQDGPLLHLEVKENESQERKNVEEKKEVNILEAKLRLLALHSRLLGPLLAGLPDKDVSFLGLEALVPT